MSKIAIRAKINSGDWSVNPSQEILDTCAEVGQYNSQSLNVNDQFEQKALWLMMFQFPSGYDDIGLFLEGLNRSIFKHQGKTPLCLKHLSRGGDPVSPTGGTWRLWQDPQDVAPAAEVAAKKAEEEAKLDRLRSTLNSALASRNQPAAPAEPEDELDAKVNSELTPRRTATARQRSKSNRGQRKGKGYTKGGKNEEEEDDQANPSYGKTYGKGKSKKEAAPEARSKAGPYQPPYPPGGKPASSSGDWSNWSRYTGWPYGPDTFSRNAISLWQRQYTKMCWHAPDRTAKLFMYFDGELHFKLHEVVEGLTFVPEDYCPVLKVKANGQLIYDRVVPYDQKWLPVKKDGSKVPEHLRESFEPGTVWTDDRWMFCRRMVGDDVCQILFFYLATFVWKQYEIYGDQLRYYQKVLITKLFYGDAERFYERIVNPLQVPTWDNQTRIWMYEQDIIAVHKETCLFGPIAALFGREVQQFLLVSPGDKLIKKDYFQYSVDQGRVSIRERKRKEADMMVIDDDRASQRTRSPRRNYWYREQQDVDQRQGGQQRYWE